MACRLSTEHGRALHIWPGLPKTTRPAAQVTVAVGTVTFEFPGLCMEFQLHNSTTIWIFSSSHSPSWHLIFFFFFLIPVNEIHHSLPSCLLLGQTVSLTFLSQQLARSVPGRRPAGARLWEPSCCSLQGPRGWAGWTGEASAGLLSRCPGCPVVPFRLPHLCGWNVLPAGSAEFSQASVSPWSPAFSGRPVVTTEA